MPTGSITFLDGTTELGTVALGHGKARLVTSGLRPGRNRIQVQYNAGPGMVPSTATFIETVRPARSGSQVISSSRVLASDPRLFSTATTAGGPVTIPAEALGVLDGPGLPGTAVDDQRAIRTGSGVNKRR